MHTTRPMCEPPNMWRSSSPRIDRSIAHARTQRLNREHET
jgi:hypothetical protein